MAVLTREIINARRISLARILIVAGENDETKELAQLLSRAGFDFTFTTPDRAEDQVSRNPPDLVMVNVDGMGEATTGLLREIHEEAVLPVIALVSREKLGFMDPGLAVSDFVVSPYETKELLLRIKRLLRDSKGVEEGGSIKAGELVLDMAKAEVLIGGLRVELTFREYELLRFLASNPGRVFTREMLLNKVWGYDYYGGDRTVDVHIRRLRSKIERKGLVFIETVRNIGYRFKEDL